MPETPAPGSHAARRASADSSSGQREMKKLRLQQSLIRLLQQGASLDGVTVADITGGVSLDKSTLYHYYSDKRSLFRDALGTHLDSHFGRTVLEMDPGEDFADYVDRFLGDIISLWLTSAPLMLTSTAQAAADPEHYQWVEGRISPWREALAAAARTAHARGEVTAPADVAVAAAVVMWSVQGTCSAALGHLDTYPEDQQRDVVDRLRAQMAAMARRTLGAPE